MAVPWVRFSGGSDDLPQKREYKSPPKKKHKHKDEDWWLFPGFTSVGGWTIYNKKVNISIPPPKKQTKTNATTQNENEDWWLFPGFASVGCRTIYHKKVNISIPPPKKKPQKNTTAQT